MHHTKVKSSNIESIGYDPGTQAMQVKFIGGKTFEYAGVTRPEFEAMQSAKSIGSYFGKNIRNRCACKEVK